MQTIKDFLMKPTVNGQKDLYPQIKKAKIKIACEIVVSFTQNIWIFCKISEILIQVSRVLKYKSENSISHESILIPKKWCDSYLNEYLRF